MLIFDGAMGTMLQSAGLPPDAPPELWNIEAPDIIEGIHRRYVESGAQILTTNTFGASKVKLSQFGLSNRQEAIISSAVKIAKNAAKDKNLAVAGDIGPLGVFLQPFGEFSFDEAYEQFFKYAKLLELQKKENKG